METRESKTTLLARARVTAKELAISATSPQARADACLDLLDELGADSRIEGLRRALHALPVDERHYWIGTLYTLMLPSKVRRSQATYFTPPAVADAVVDLAIEAGFNLSNDDVLDPTAGGAAFLSTIAGRMASAGLVAKDVATLRKSLNGAISRLTGLVKQSEIDRANVERLIRRTMRTTRATRITPNSALVNRQPTPV